jgi:Uma2 family endonuclease
VSKQLTVEILELFPHQGEWTEADYFRLPDTNHYVELSEGRLVILDMPTDSHQKAVGRLFKAIDGFAEENALGEVRIAPLSVRLWQGKIREPDIVYMAAAHEDRITEDYWGVPDLVVEVISRSTAQTDRSEKFVEYAQAGVSEYWLVDTAKQTIEVFTLERGAYILLGKWGTAEIAHSGLLTGFEIAVEAIVR